MFEKINKKIGRPSGKPKGPLLARDFSGKTKGLVLALVILIFLTCLVSPNLILPGYPKQNEYSPRDIKSPIEFNYKDEEATKRRIEEAISRVLPVYDLDLRNLGPLLQELDELFKETRELRKDGTRSLALKVRELKKGLKREISSDSLSVLLSYHELENIETGVKEALIHLLSNGVTGVSEDKLARDAVFGLRVVKITPAGEEEETIISDSKDIYLARDLSKTIPYLDWPYLTLAAKNAAVEIVTKFVTPNLSFNPDKTQASIEETKMGVKPVTSVVGRGEMIVREGDWVDHLTATKLAALREKLSQTNWRSILGFGVLLLSFMIIIGIYLHRYRPGLLIRQGSLLILGIITIITLIVARAITITPYPGYIIPLASASMLIAILLDEELALFTTIFLALTLGILLGSRFEFIVFFLGGGAAAIYAVSFARTRGTLIRAGLITGLANAAIIIAYGLISQDRLSALGGNTLWGMANGLIAAVLTIGGLPLFENIFGITTNFKLLELADLNTPLMRDLLMHAPGTHHHSLLVGNLAEQATDAIGANPLLARVASYYHDIGKINKPDYYVENQNEGDSRHKGLKPTLSASVLKAHVKKGIELAKDGRLPPAIIDIIRQHHGTTLMTYFHDQAQREVGEERVDENDFRYLGPRPQTREAAIVLLADAVEAATRTLTKPTAVRIEELVKRIIEEKFIDSQLDECDLSLQDLTRINQSFVRTLTSAYHSRIEYPEGEKANGEGSGGQSQERRDKNQADQGDSRAGTQRRRGGWC